MAVVNDSWAEAFVPYDGLVPGRVARTDRGRCAVLTAHGEIQAGRRGDWVALDDDRRVAAILSRRTAFVRGGVPRESRGGLSGDSPGHVLAANVDVALIVEPAARTRTWPASSGCSARLAERRGAVRRHHEGGPDRRPARPDGAGRRGRARRRRARGVRGDRRGAGGDPRRGDRHVRAPRSVGRRQVDAGQRAGRRGGHANAAGAGTRRRTASWS
jgi:hypothetical protein